MTSSGLPISLETQFEVLTKALNASNDGFAIWTRDCENFNEPRFVLNFMNHAGARATGREPQQLVNRTIEDVVGVEESKGLISAFSRCLDTGQPLVEIVEVKSPQGWIGSYENRVIPIPDNHVLTMFRDVSEERRERKRLEWLTSHDSLTGIPNRNLLESKLESKSMLIGNGAGLGFVFIDIDDFKSVNDSYGHDLGDQLLIAFANKLQESVPPGSTCARIAGDEFGVIIQPISSEPELRTILVRIMSHLMTEYQLSEHTLEVACSAGGVAVLEPTPIQEIMRIADKAMYAVKADQKGNFRLTQVG